MTTPKIALALALVLAALSVRAQPAPASGHTNPPPIDPFERAMLPADPAAPEVKTNMPIRELGPGLFQLGDVRIDKPHRTVSFPARLNLVEGPMEYFLVTSWGKTHESILKTDTEPFRIHLAMLLLDAGITATNAATNGAGGGGFISHPGKARLPGQPIDLEIKWSSGGREIRHRAEELIYNTEQKSVMRQGNWVYTGSIEAEGLFLAEIDGSIVSLVTDAESLINNEGPGHDNDTIWAANTNNLPPTNIVVEVTIKINPKPQK